MNDGESAMQEVVVATAPIADAAVREAWPYKKVLIAVLPPTLALFSVLVGVWESGNRDRAAQATADADRAEAAKAREEARADEVKKEQAATARAQALREAELALPKYEELLTTVHATRTKVAQCQENFNAYLGTLGLTFGLDGALIETLPEPSLAPESTATYAVDDGVVTSCSKIEGTIEQLTLSLDQALLVTSTKELEMAAIHLTDTLQELSEHTDIVLDRVRKKDGGGGYEVSVKTQQMYGPDGEPILGADGQPVLWVWWADDETSVIDDLNALNMSLAAIEPASDLLVEEARRVVLARNQGRATLVVGGTAWEFDNFLCEFGYGNTRSDTFSFLSYATEDVVDSDGSIRMELTVEDPTGRNRVIGDAVTQRIVVDHKVESLGASPDFSSSQLTATFIGDDITAEGTFWDEVNDPGHTTELPGTLTATCGG